MSTMFTNWISKGAEVITSGAKSITQTNNNNADVNAIVKEVLTKLQISLSKQLGQNCEGVLQSVGSDILKQKQLEKNLIETKQKYHQLVAQCESQNQSIKLMMQNIIQFMKNLCNTLKNQDMLTPLKDLQSAFYLCNTAKVDKQLKYFGKLYDAALEDHVKVCVNSKQDECKDQVNLFKGLNKNLQVELFRSRNNCADLQKRVNQLHSKNQQISDKLSILQKLGAESVILASSKQKQKAEQRQNQLLQKIKILERQKIKLQRINRQSENQVVKSTAAIEVIKSNQDNIIEEMKREIKKKQTSYQTSMSKLCSQKINLQDKLGTLNSELQNLKKQVDVLRLRQVSPRKDHKATQIKQLNQRIKQLEQDVQVSKRKIEGMVSKQMMKGLFLGYQDQSKQWSIRRDVKNQIYLLLDVKPKTNAKTENKTQDRKWFGLF